MKRAKKKRKLKVKKHVLVFFILLFIVYLLYLFFREFIGFDIKNIYVYGNKLLKDQEIIDQISFNNYPNFYTTSSLKIKKKIKENEIVKDVKVRKVFFQKLKIYITEYNVLFFNSQTEEYVLENGKRIKNITDNWDIPTLINYVPSEQYKSLLKKMNKIDKSVIDKVSEIKYDPNEVDPDRFLLFMNDQNYVYLTLTKFDLLNKYDEAVKQLEGKKGILYLDSGNYFEIKSS